MWTQKHLKVQEKGKIQLLIGGPPWSIIFNTLSLVLQLKTVDSIMIGDAHKKLLNF